MLYYLTLASHSVALNVIKSVIDKNQSDVSVCFV